LEAEVGAAVTDVVRALHATPQQAVIEVAGAGTLAVSWLHAVGGSSRTVLEANDRYCHASLAELLGTVPASAVTAAAARAMAAAALRRARSLAEPGTPVVGAGCTAALATDRRRRGADRAFVAVAGALGTAVSELSFPSAATAVVDDGDRSPDEQRDVTRRRQEEAVSALLVAELAAACGVDAARAGRLRTSPGTVVAHDFLPAEPLAGGAAGERGCVVLDRDGRVAPGGVEWRRVALLSGAYYPLHAGHLALGDAAASFLGCQVMYELPLVNADKAPISLREAQCRAAQFAGRAPVVLSWEPLFAAKARLFPGAIFVLGADTAARLVATRFYGGSACAMSAALDELAAHGCGILVAGRRFEGRYVTLADLAARIPERHRGLFQALPEEMFRYDISSTEIRARRAAAETACH
jgi:hypothetical protein